MKINITKCESRDWVILKINNNKYYSGHSIPDHIWIKLLELSGVYTETITISDEEMDNYE